MVVIQSLRQNRSSFATQAKHLHRPDCTLVFRVSASLHTPATFAEVRQLAQGRPGLQLRVEENVIRH